MQPEQAPNIPVQMPLNFDQETPEERSTRLREEYQEIFKQAPFYLDDAAVEAALADPKAIAAEEERIWNENKKSDNNDLVAGFRNAKRK